MDRLYFAGGLAAVILYTPLVLRMALHGNDLTDQNFADTRNAWWRVSWLGMSLGIVVTSLAMATLGRVPQQSTQAIFVVGQAFVILGGVTSQTWLHIVEGASRKAFWFAAAIPLLVLAYVGAH